MRHKLLRMRYVYFMMFLFAADCLHAQDITGKWVGNYNYNFFSSMPDKLVVEIYLHNDSIVSGTSHLHHGRGKYEHYTISGVYHKADSTIFFKEDSTIGVQLGFGASNVLGNYDMKLKVTDTMMYLNGRWKENNSSIGLMNCKVWLQKPVPPKPKNNNAAAEPVKDEKLNRAVNVQKLIEIDETEKDSIKIMLVDNGQIDGDIVSVYLNDSVLLSNLPLTGKSQVFWISISKDMPTCRIAMIAESQGSIPPCTARMTVVTRKRFYDIDLSSDAKSTGTLQLFLKE